jgi:hypothetical protein
LKTVVFQSKTSLAMKVMVLSRPCMFLMAEVGIAAQALGIAEGAYGMPWLLLWNASSLANPYLPTRLFHLNWPIGHEDPGSPKLFRVAWREDQGLSYQGRAPLPMFCRDVAMEVTTEAVQVFEDTDIP